jgi:hypothetical protein
MNFSLNKHRARAVKRGATGPSKGTTALPLAAGPAIRQLLDQDKWSVKRLLADKAYDANRVRKWLKTSSITNM